MFSRHSYIVSTIRTAILAPIFILGCLSIVITQEVAKVVFQNSPLNLQAIINLTKKNFIALLTFIATVIYPTKLLISYDPSESKDLSFQAHNGHLSSQLNPNSVLISNHQIYTDWLSLWHILSLSNLGDCIYIYLKDLSWIPILGKGMKNFNFLFLSRKWEKDKVLLTNQLLEIDANARGVGPANGVKKVFSTSDGAITHWPEGNNSSQIWPYEIILFPEGTVTSKRTRGLSEKFIKEKGLPDLHNVLLPRVRGLYITLKKLRKTVEVVYDITTGYSGLKAGENGEDIYTLKRFFLLGHGPKVIHHHFRAWHLKDIPLGTDDQDDIDKVKEEDLKEFEKWLFEVWYAKDKLMEEFYKHGTFNHSERKTPMKSVLADMKIKSYFNLFNTFTPLLFLGLVIRLIWIGISKLIW